MTQGLDGATPSMSKPLADIIITCWNHLNITKRCVQCIRENTIVDYRLILSDGASTDGTGEWLRAQKDITAIIAETNEGNIAAINRGLEVSTAPYIVHMDNDVEVGGKGWLKLLIEALKAHPEAGWMSAYQSGTPGAKPGAIVVGLRPPGSSCVVMRRKVRREIGFWDEDFTWAYNGDSDYAYRIKLAGYQFGEHRGVTFRHEGSITVKSKGQYEEYVALGKHLLEEKWPDVNWANPWR